MTNVFEDSTALLERLVAKVMKENKPERATNFALKSG